jgi:hypothetical protein
MIDVIRAVIRARGEEIVSVPGARLVARLPGPALVPLCVAGAEIACFV